MSRMRRFGAAIVLAGLVGGGLAMSTARLEAKRGGDGDGGGLAAVCASLLSTANNTSYPKAIRDVAQFFYDYLGCASL